MTTSVIIPARNAGRFIKKAVSSALACRSDEVIVVDHSSDDDTVDQIPRDSAVTVVYAPPGGGPGRAKNVGLKRASGDLVTFLDADDILVNLRDRIKSLEKHSDVDAVFGRIAGLIDSDGLPLADLPFLAWMASADSKNRALGAITADRIALSELPGYFTLMYRRSLLEEIGPFDETLDRAEDFDLAYRCALKKPIGFIDLPCVMYRIHDANTSVARSHHGRIIVRPETREAHTRALRKHGLV